MKNKIIKVAFKFLGLEQKTSQEVKQTEILKYKRLINIEERMGRMFIVYQNTGEYTRHAFIELDADLTIADALKLLEAARKAAVDYRVI